MGLHKTLTKEEEAEYRQGARNNWRSGMPINITWHPIVLDEVQKISLEALLENKDELRRIKAKISNVIAAYPEFNTHSLERSISLINKALDDES